MKAFLCKKVLKTLSLIFVMSLLLGLLVPFSAVELAEDESDVAQGAADIKPYVVFDGEAIKDGRITGKHQGEYQFIEEDSTFLRFEADYSESPIDPFVTFTPGGSYSADVYKYVSIVVRTKGASSSLGFWLYYVAGDSSSFSGGCVVSSQYATTDDWQIVTFNLSSSESWTGKIKNLRLDVCNTIHEEPFDIAAVIFSETPQAVYDGAFEALMGMFAPKQVISNFAEGEELCFSAESSDDMVLHNTKVSTREGKLILEGSGNLEDPYAGFMYHDLMDARGVDKADRLTTEDFNNVVIRFRAGNVGGATRFELFLFTGENFCPFEISDGNGGKRFASTPRVYRPAADNAWQGLSFKLDDERCAEAWQGAFNGIRLDWCGNSGTGGYMEISDVAFFADDASAASVTSAMNTVTVPLKSVVPTEHPFLTPLEQDSDWIVLSTDIIDEMIVDSDSASHSVHVEDGVKSVIVKTTSPTNGPYVEMGVEGVDISNHRYLSVLVKRRSSALEHFVVYYKSEGGQYAAYSGTAAAYDSLGGWQVLTFLFDDSAFADGDVSSLRLDFAGAGECNVGDGCEIATMTFSSSSEDAYDAAYYMLSQVYVPVQILNDFDANDVKYFDVETTGATTSVAASDGNLVYSSKVAGKDPGKMFSYTKYAEANGINPVTTMDFRYTVVRYRSQGIGASNSYMELFILTGDAKTLFDMASIYDIDSATGAVTKLECRHCARANYLPDTREAWRAVCLDMAVGDGYETSTHLKNGWYRDDGNYTFSGFRFDWCASAQTSSLLQISDIIFFQDASDAAAMSAALSAVSVPVRTTVVPDDDEDLTFEESDTESETDASSETESLPDLNESTEEIPDFVESTEDSSSESEKNEGSATESETVIDTDSESDTGTDTDTDSDSSDETESKEQSESDGSENDDSEGSSNIGNIYDTEAEQREGEGSQLPFYIACCAMVVLSVISVISVLIIRSNEKSQKEE